ncbi:hypothetical protein C7999DRAFT_28743 [Corynascus novoguineensis]|uniref:Methionyl/Valyl/Leucyl/Isoleucyl-tRNA synthetase anticodon-binding domain-containing protein n=1 Tax=Corynascus novoguineensis TaxID=1126955 RepID=A0AAN7CYF3_9PEZI|nr:hypothetical protein C7999DRAFT_28743 [Corynascus novoguineensis]
MESQEQDGNPSSHTQAAARKLSPGAFVTPIPPLEFAKTGQEALSERWILHQLNAIAPAVHELLETRRYSRLAQAMYRYWYDDETSKAILHEGSEEAKVSALDTLYATVEMGLAMMRSFMPI